MVTGGLAGRGQRGLYDRFRGRLVWPIRDITGDAVGFGARRLFDDDRIEAKYLNTSETPIYKKSQVLYGLDAAKKAISRDRPAVVVEGYTDVMACHLSGVETRGRHLRHGVRRRAHQDAAPDHARREPTSRRPRSSSPSTATRPGRRPPCGPSARTSAGPPSRSSPVGPRGMDPCELRIAKGDAAVRALVDDAVPMFEFAVRTTIRRFDLDTAEGRVQAMRAVAPIVGRRSATPACAPSTPAPCPGWLGIEVEQMAAEVHRARTAGRAAADERGQTASRAAAGRLHADEVPPSRTASTRTPARPLPVPDLRDPVVFTERQLLQALIQYPAASRPTAQSTALRARGVRGAGPPGRARRHPDRRGTPGRGHHSGLGRHRRRGGAPRRCAAWCPSWRWRRCPTRFDPSTGCPPQRYLELARRRVRDARWPG